MSDNVRVFNNNTAVSQVEQELLALPEYLSSSPVFVGFVILVEKIGHILYPLDPPPREKEASQLMI
jgi:hypothetical protein